MYIPETGESERIEDENENGDPSIRNGSLTGGHIRHRERADAPEGPSGEEREQKNTFDWGIQDVGLGKPTGDTIFIGRRW
jgi:hypothetical protein